MKISVVIAVYNRAEYLPTAVRSVIEAGYDDVEVLIVDDGSSDASLEVSQKLESENRAQIRVLRHPKGANLGISESRNLGIRKSAGDVICFLDSDDAFLPNRFASAVSALRQDPTLDGCYEPIIRIEDWDFQAFLKDWVSRPIPTPRLLVDSDGRQPKDVLRGLLLEGREFWHTNAVTVRRSLLNKTGLFDPRFRVAEDTHLWLRMAAVGRMLGVQKKQPVAAVRRHCGHSWQPTPDEANRVFTHVLVSTLHWAQERSDEIDPEIVTILEQGLYRSAIDTLGLLRERGRWSTTLATLLHVIRAAPHLARRNLLWRKAFEPQIPGKKSAT